MKYIEQLSDLITRAIDSADDKWAKLAALGIGPPEIVERETCIVESYAILQEFKRAPLLDIYSLTSGKQSFMAHNIFSQQPILYEKKTGPRTK